MRSVVVLALPLVLLLSCGKKNQPQSTAEAAPSDETPEPEPAVSTRLPSEDAPSVDAKMQTHFAIIERARQAVVAGDVAKVRTSGSALNFLNPTEEEVPEAWRPYLADLKVTALQVETVETPREAAQMVSQVATTCARCHEGLGAGDVIPDPVESTVNAPGVMRRHDRAVEDMWRGLIRGDEEEYAEGAKALTESAFFDPESGKAAEEPFVAMADQVKVHAQEAVEAESSEDRAAAMGAILGACVDCHEVARPD